VRTIIPENEFIFLKKFNPKTFEIYLSPTTKKKKKKKKKN
jgi:hypothetical protein